MTIPANPQSDNPSAGPATTEVPIDAPPPQEVIIEEVAPKPKVLQVPTHAMKKIKDEAAAHGRKSYQAELDAQAVELGYKDHADWVRASKEARAASSSTPASTPSTAQPEAKPAAGGSGDDAIMQENQRLKGELDKALNNQKRINRQIARQTREANRLKEQLLAQEATTELKLAAKDAGVVDVDYAVTVYQRMIAGKTEAELADVDETKFFGEDLRKSHPHLYQPVDKPVNTGTKNEQAITKPATGPAQQGQQPGTGGAQNGRLNARNMTPQQFQELLASRGMSNPSTGGAIG